MGKKRNKGNNGHKPPHSPVVATAPSDDLLAREAANLLTEAKAIDPILPEPEELPGETLSLDEAVKAARVVKESFRRKEAGLEARLQKQNDVEQDLRSRRNNLDEEEKRLSELKKELKKKEVELNQRDEAQCSREELLAQRQAEATAGFIAKRREILAPLEQKIEELVSSAAEHEKSLHAVREEARTKWDAERAAVLLREEEMVSALREQERKLKQRERELDWLEQDLKDEKENLDQRLSEQLRVVEADLKTRLTSAHARCEELAGELSKYQEAERASGGRSREQLLSENKDLRAERDRLQIELGSKLDDEQMVRLRHLESQNETLRDEVGKFRQQLAEREVQAGRMSIGAAEIQNLRDQKLSWETREAALRAVNEQLRTDLNQLTQAAGAQTPFPALTKFDSDEKLSLAPRRRGGKSASLKEIIHRARHAMANARFYYSEADIRCFVGGIASNQLHLLQGISGTGKSSLPRELAAALGWGTEIIEVQSGWRDRADLLGYYNAFEKKFYESKFLQALYKAQCPQYADLPFLITLDEMNLSHPEHYFADVLSAMEKPEEDRWLDIMTAPTSQAPRRLDDGRRLLIPPNVWFIGTANHDETTKDFAPKTYDRSHVMEFPRHPENFNADGTFTEREVRFSELIQLFEEAEMSHKKLADDARKLLESKLLDPLEELGLGWGNRFEAQLRKFIPVVVAGGGEAGEALDHLLATKILRKLRGRFDLEVDKVNGFRSTLVKSWSDAGFGEAMKSQAVIDGELKRLDQR